MVDDNLMADLARWSCLLKEPPAPVQVNGETFYLHPEVLRKSTFFADMLDLPGDAPNVDLPCTEQEFVLLVLALYHDEELGSPWLPIPDFAAGARLMMAADKVGVAHILPEESLADSISSLEDLAAAAEFASTRPGLCGELERLLPEKIVQGVNDATDTQGWQQVWSALEAFRGHLDTKQLADAANERMRGPLFGPQPSFTDVESLAHIAVEFLSVWDAERVFDGLPRRVLQTSGGEWSGFDKALHRHVLRCAEEGALSKLLEPLSRDRDEPVRLGVWFAIRYRGVLASALRSSTPDQAEFILSHLSHAPVWDLVDILSAEVLAMASPEGQRRLMRPLLACGEVYRWARQHGRDAIAALGEPLRQTVVDALEPQPTEVVEGHVPQYVADESDSGQVSPRTPDQVEWSDAGSFSPRGAGGGFLSQ